MGNVKSSPNFLTLSNFFCKILLSLIGASTPVAYEKYISKGSIKIRKIRKESQANIFVHKKSILLALEEI